MARPRSDHKREAIMDAAIRVFAARGLGAPTAEIAREAKVANGSLFTYFATKTELLNALYIELKSEMAAGGPKDLAPDADVREQMLNLWVRWMDWAARYPERRRTLALLGVSDEISAESRQAGHAAMAGIAKLMERSRANGPMRDVPLPFVVALMSAAADTTIDYIIEDPEHADQHARTGFEALWRMIAS